MTSPAIFPLSSFPKTKRDEIERLAASASAPPKWLDFGMCQIVSRAWYEWNRRAQKERKLARRLRIAERDEWVCGLCHEHIDPGDLHIDHIKPFSRGGPTIPSNLQATHSWCNMHKGARYEDA